MRMNSRQSELLGEIYSYFLESGVYPDRQDFRDTHSPEDLELLNTLEYNLGFIKADGGKYKFDLVYFLASPHGQKEKVLTFRAAVGIQELYKQYGQGKKIPFAELKIQMPPMSQAGLRRALTYLSELNYINLDANDTVILYEKIRTLKSADSLIPPYALTKWQEATGQQENQSPPLDNSAAFAALIGQAKLVTTNSPSKSDSSHLPLDWVEDSLLRQIIGRNHSECQSSYFGQSYKCALIMAGSCLEGVLLAALTKQATLDSAAEDLINKKLTSLAGSLKKGTLVLNDLDLRRLIDLAVACKLMHPLQKQLSDVTADFRNYVHPGKEMRTKFMKFDKHEVDSALATLNMVVRDLSQHFIENPVSIRKVPKRKKPLVIIFHDNSEKSEQS